MAFRLISTICQQTADLAQKLQEAEHKITRLECNALGRALGSPMWTREVTQGNSKGSRVKGIFVEHRGLLRDWDDTRSSPHPSVVALGCLDEGDERDKGQGCYSRQLGRRPGMDTTSGVEYRGN